MKNKIYTYNNIVTRAGCLIFWWGALLLCLLYAKMSTFCTKLRGSL